MGDATGLSGDAQTQPAGAAVSASLLAAGFASAEGAAVAQDNPLSTEQSESAKDAERAEAKPADEAGLAIPPPSDDARPKTAAILRAEILDGTGLTEVPITKQVGRDVADVTSQLLSKGNEGLAVDELGMSKELSADEAVLDAPRETEKQQM